MNIRLLGAGGPAGVNTIRALVAAGHTVYARDDNWHHLQWAIDAGALPDVGYPADLVMAQPDSLIEPLAMIDEPHFLPSLETIRACQAKGAAGQIWFAEGLRGPAIPIDEPYPDMLHLAADRLGFPFWLRADRGAGANKAIKVEKLPEAFHWMRFWQARSVHVDWIAEEFLPGRDLAWSSIWSHGQLVVSFLRERLEYLYPHLSPEGLTGTPTIARILHDPKLEQCGYAAVKVIDDRPHGIFSVDLREDTDGTARPTEINAGRGFTTFGLWSLYGPHNFLDIYARLHAGERFRRIRNPLPDGLTLSRHIDCGHRFTWTRQPAHIAST